MHKNLIIVTILTAILSLSGCSAHRIDIQQGNKVTPENFSKLKEGMSSNQVVFLLGSPLLKAPFHKGRWDYLYYLKPGNKDVKQSRLTLYFDGDTLIRIDDSGYSPKAHGDALEVKPDAIPHSHEHHHAH